MCMVATAGGGASRTGSQGTARPAPRLGPPAARTEALDTQAGQKRPAGLPGTAAGCTAVRLAAVGRRDLVAVGELPGRFPGRPERVPSLGRLLA